MKRLLQRIRHIVASPTGAACLLALLLPLRAAAEGYCNNPIPPCDPADPASSCYKPPDPPPKCEPKVCDKCTKSPCYVGSGVYAFDENDLKIATTGFPITVTRLYQSTHTIDGESGIGWTSSLSTRLHYAVFLRSAPSTYQREADIRLPNGTLYRFVENANGTYTPPEGRFDTLVRNGDGTWDLWLQRTRSHYHFSATGNLLEMVDDFGNTQTWTYMNDRLQRVEDTSGSGRYIDITYGADGRISDITDLTGRTVHYAYGASGVMTSATNPAGQATSYSYTNGKYVPLLTAVTDNWGRNITTIVYDAQDRTRSYTDRGETFTYTYAYNGVGTTTAKSDSSGNIWQYPFGSGGVVLDSIPPGGGAAAHDDYYSNGLVQLHVDPVGVKTYYTYNAQGHPVTITYDYQGATAVEWRHTYDPAFPEQVVTVTPYTPGTNNVHPHWQARKFDYYAVGTTTPGGLHHIYEVDDDGVTARPIRTFTYNSQGRVLTDTTATGAVTTYEYDTAGNRIRVTAPPNNDAGNHREVTFTYDSLGRRLTVTDPANLTTSFTWDVLDRMTSIAEPVPAGSPLTFVTTVVYDEYDTPSATLFERAIDSQGRTTRYGSDAWGQLVQKIDTTSQSVRYTFTKGLLSTKTDENNYVTTYAWDALRRLQTVTYADGTFERYTYFADSSVASFRDRAAQTMNFTYDRHKRSLTQTYPGGASISWTYSGQKLLTVVDTLASPAETNTMAWNGSFRLASESQAARGTVSFTYTTEGRVATESLSAGGPTTTYDYYPDGSPRTIAWSPVTGSFHYDYTIAGQTSSITFPNGQTRSFSYDALGRRLSVANVHPTAGNLASFAYGYDIDAFSGQPTKPGLRTSITTDLPALSLSAAVTKLGYDARGRLVRTDYPSGSTYGGASSLWSYDSAGNRVTATANGVTSSHTYAKYASNPLNASEMISDGANSYVYDANGNNVSRSGPGGNSTFGWDLNNRLVSIGGAQAAAYKYDVINRRTAKTVGGVTTTYVYSGLNLISESGADIARYLHGPGFDTPLAMLRGGEIYYFDVDVLGSVVAVNDASGTVKNSYAWDAWGVAVAKNEAVANPFGYTAREHGEAGLTYYRSRYYDAAIGSFRSVDPLVSLTGLALAQGAGGPFAQIGDYAYADGAPSMFTDPLGLGSCELCDEAYDNKISDCQFTNNFRILGCATGAALCLIGSKNPRFCYAVFTSCAAYATADFQRCLKNGQRDYNLCLKGCGLCPLPPPPPLQYTPVPPPIKDPVPWSSIQ